MKRMHWIAAAGAAALILGGAAAVAAAPKDAKGDRNTPAGWSYEIKNGKRVPRMERKVNADGSWTEQRRQGNCTVTRTGRSGEVRETRACD